MLRSKNVVNNPPRTLLKLNDMSQSNFSSSDCVHSSLSSSNLATKQTHDFILDKELYYASIDDNYFVYHRKYNFTKDHPVIIQEQQRKIRNIACPSQFFIRKHSIKLPETKKHKTLILDLDETLVHTLPCEKCDVVLDKSKKICFSIRPYTKELLEYAKKYYEIIAFTASIKPHADAVLNYLDPDGKIFSYRLYRDHCYPTEKGFVKDLRLLKNRKAESTIIVDNSIISFAFQPENGIPILSWYGDKRDKELLKLIKLLKTLNSAGDVRDTIKPLFELDG